MGSETRCFALVRQASPYTKVSDCHGAGGEGRPYSGVIALVIGSAATAAATTLRKTIFARIKVRLKRPSRTSQERLHICSSKNNRQSSVPVLPDNPGPELLSSPHRLLKPLPTHWRMHVAMLHPANAVCQRNHSSRRDDEGLQGVIVTSTLLKRRQQRPLTCDSRFRTELATCCSRSGTPVATQYW